MSNKICDLSKHSAILVKYYYDNENMVLIFPWNFFKLLTQKKNLLYELQTSVYMQFCYPMLLLL